MGMSLKVQEKAFRTLLIFIAFGNFACQKPIKTQRASLTVNYFADAQGEQVQAYLHSANELKADFIMNNFVVRCGDRRSCPSGMGAAVSRFNETTTQTCTSFLIASDIAAINRHCLPERIAFPGADCSNITKFVFPETGLQSFEAVRCHEVIAVSPTPITDEKSDKMMSDYAILRLERKVDRTPFQVRASGIDDNQFVDVWSMTPAADNESGVIESHECLAVQNSPRTPLYSSRWSPVIHLAHCPLVKGNSGSAVLEKGSNSALAIISQASIELAFSRASNFACIEISEIGFNHRNNDACSVGTDPQTIQAALQQIYQTEDDAVHEILLSQFHDFQNKNATIQWKIIKLPPSLNGGTDRVRLRETVEPICIMNIDSSIWSEPKFSKITHNNALLKFDLPLWEVREELDENTRLELTLTSSISKVTYGYTPRDSSLQFGASTLTLVEPSRENEPNRSDTSSFFKKIELAQCTSHQQGASFGTLH
jgi:hypothetical protein